MVYAARNKVDGKVYVGQTRNLEKRKSRHKSRAQRDERGAFYGAIREHGFQAFEWAVLSDTSDQNEMNRQEHESILKFKANNPQYGYNKNLPWFTVSQEEVNEAMAAALAGLAERVNNARF